MSFSGWSAQYSVHIPVFDAQHQKLLTMIEEVQESAKSGASPDLIARLFDELLDYTQLHFQNEEQAMRRHDFPGLPAHRTEHQALIRKALDYHRKFLEGKTMISVEIMRYLNEWLLRHIDTVDRQYDSFFQNKEIP